DQKSLRRAVHAPVDRNIAERIIRRRDVRIAERREPIERGTAVVLPVEAVNGDAARARKLDEIGVLLATPDAPCRPHVEERDLAGEIRAADLAGRVREAREAE